MNIFKKTPLPFASRDKELALIEMINHFNMYKKEINKINTEYSTYWWGTGSIFVSFSIIPLFFIPYIVGGFYLAGIALRLKYNKWVKQIKKEHNEIIENFVSFMQENEKVILTGFYENMKNNELEEMFEKILYKCANNEYDTNLIFQIDNFIYKYQEFNKLKVKEEKAADLKKSYQLPFKEKNTYEIPLTVKEKYKELA